MYFIAKGQCSVEERIHKARRFEHIRTLKTNDHFGEISFDIQLQTNHESYI